MTYWLLGKEYPDELQSEKMNTKEFAEKISGFEYPARELDGFSEEAAEHGLIYVYGMSDDLLITSGIYSDEHEAYDGTKIRLGTKGVSVEAVWCPKETEDDGRSWLVKADCPHETFKIMEDGIEFCTCVVISKEHLNA